MNAQDRYFAAQRITLTPRTRTGAPWRRVKRRSPLRAFVLGAALGAALVWLADAHAVPPLPNDDPLAARLLPVCVAEARNNMADPTLAHLPEPTRYFFLLHRCMFGRVRV